MNGQTEDTSQHGVTTPAVIFVGDAWPNVLNKRGRNGKTGKKDQMEPTRNKDLFHEQVVTIEIGLLFGNALHSNGTYRKANEIRMVDKKRTKKKKKSKHKTNL
jgi:hypothetical protein